MVSIGCLAYGGKLVLDELEVKNTATINGSISGSTTVSGSLTSSHKVLGADDKNLVQMHQSGSLFYLKWSHVEQLRKLGSGAHAPFLRLSSAAERPDAPFLSPFVGREPSHRFLK